MIANSTTISADDLLTDLSETTFEENFNRRPFKIGHHLPDHSLFDLDNLLKLSRRLPESSVEYNAGNLPVSQDPNKTPQNGLSIADTIKRIEQNESWLVLKNIEQDSLYGNLLDQCLDQMQPFTDPISPGMTRREAYIFVSSPGSVTPYHIDPENNFLLQVRGSKNVQVFDPADRQILSEKAIEDFFSGAHRNLQFDKLFTDRSWLFELQPGEGLHVPVVAPHWVQNGPEVSVSFSITFQTNDSMRRQSLYRFNRNLRRIGWRPAPVGEKRWSDSAKFGVVKSIRALKSLTGK